MFVCRNVTWIYFRKGVEECKRHNEKTHKNKQYKGYVIPISEMNGFWFLRLTTLAVSPKNRARAFNSHFKQQVDNGLFRPDTTELSQLIEIAKDQIYVGHPC